MKKIFAFAIALIACLTSQAALQYEIISTPSATQAWTSAQTLTIKITGGSGDMWFSSFVSNWYQLDDLGDYAQMTAGNYGYTNLATGVETAGSGTTGIVTFSDPDTFQSVSGIGYYVGNFAAGDEISFWMTHINGRVGESTGEVGVGNGVDSRQANILDLADNTRINFGYFGASPNSVEFVISTSDGPFAPSGQPLPGVLAALALGGCATGIKAFRRRRK